MIHVDEAMLARYQAIAERNPVRYRLRLALTAIAGDAMLTLAQVAPVVLPILIGTLLFPHPWLIGMASVAVVFFVWMTRPQLRPTGRPITRKEAPSLFEVLDSMCERLDVPKNIEVHLDDEFNASAAEGRGFFGLLGTRRIMTIGMPFLACMSRDDVLAVVAHELGHFSRRHSLLGNWLYRARMGWADFAVPGSETASAFERATRWYARSFAPHFLTVSLVHSRACEYEADRDAAALVGQHRFALALTRVAIVVDQGWRAFQIALAREQETAGEPPGNYHARLHETIEIEISRHREAWLDKVGSSRSGWQDTHPALADRLIALGTAPDVEPVTEPAGKALLGSAWESMRAEFDSKWFEVQAPVWRLEHAAYRSFWAPLLLRRDHGGAMSSMDRLQLSRMLRSIDPSAGMAELERLRSEYPDDRAVAFAWAAAGLREGRSEAVAVMHDIAESEVSYAAAAYERLVSNADRIGDGASVRRFGARYELAAKAGHEAQRHAIDAVQAGQGAPPAIDEGALRFLQEVPSVDHCMAGIWIASQVVPLTDGRRLSGSQTMHVLILQIDTGMLHSKGDDEDAVRERCRSALASLLPINECVIAMSYLTTEALPEFIAACVRVGVNEGAPTAAIRR